MVTRDFFKRWIPLCERLTGRLPGWALGGGEALPGAAALDWSRSGMSPGYFKDDPACAGWYQPHHFRGHMQMWSMFASGTQCGGVQGGWAFRRFQENVGHTHLALVAATH
ncbi:MAG: hypothetical protein U1D25_04125 [Hydrogenophaga sp.]|uniref:hypothetical protein n=1 Tax=Hydrogenophaga sp. TaxID=1904254 RepID=UPI00276744A9|nr:hypothetical protein [Hydrogenophaga sp.]MDP2416533.1 hypothetical protein [Hydrogenophaga sp.]MDZ4187286.1 hypothetical protein [Hydrogenophaga sp.]